MADSPELEMRTVEDFLKVPIDKIDHCLEDFKSWLMVYHSAEAMAQYRVKQMGITLPELQKVFKSDHFVWIDDGKHDATITISKAEKAPGT